MPYAYAVTTTIEDSEPALIEEAESYTINGSALRFYEKHSGVGDVVTLFNWDNVVQVTPLTEDEHDGLYSAFTDI